MSDSFVEEFLKNFDDSRYPADFCKDYELMECLAHNKLGETLLVKDRQTGKFFVSKCYIDKTLSVSTSETDLLKNIQYCGLPTLIGEYKNEEMICVVRNFVEGTPLDQYVQQNKLTVRQIIDIIHQLCDILTFLHNQKPPIIHRDIKPQNIIINAEGRISLIDFGISRTYDDNSREDTICFGTKYYAAPEQYGFAQTDPRSDIFSMGVLLYWLLTGRLDIKKAGNVISNRRLLGVIKKCTAFDPKDRFLDAAQAKDVLTGRRNRRRSFAIVGILLVILTGILQFITSRAISFEEPLIEEAARLSLGKDVDSVLTAEDLLAVEEIYVLGNHPAADRASFDDLVEEFAQSGGSMERGAIDSLEDLGKFENIRQVSLAYQNITDLSPLAQLSRLDLLDLRNNSQLKDLAPLSQSISLTTLVLYDTNVSDFSVLKGCPRLSLLDAGKTPFISIAALDDLRALRILGINDTPLRDLDGITDLQLLETLYLTGIPVVDLSPLLDLPQLAYVELGEEMKSLVRLIADQAQFEIIYR